MNLYLNMQKQ